MLFFKNTKNITEVSEAVISEEQITEIKSVPSVPSVEEIHNAVLTAADEILLLDEQLKKEVINDNYVDLYKKFGFSSVEKLKQSVAKNELREKVSETAEAARYYAHHYPQNKFISETALAGICSKYGLVIGKPSDYTGDIPEFHIKQIIDFKLREDDIYIMYVRQSSSYTSPIKNDLMSKNNFLKVLEASITEYTVLEEIKTHILEGKDYYCGEYSSIPNIFDQRPWNETISSNERSFKIVAPPSMMNMQNKRVVDNHLVDEVEDPIVLCPVKEGYLVVALWGDESKIEDLQNPNLN